VARGSARGLRFEVMGEPAHETSSSARRAPELLVEPSSGVPGAPPPRLTWRLLVPILALVAVAVAVVGLLS